MITACFYRGYELGNGVNDWAAAVGGLTPAALTNTLYGDKVSIAAVGANSYRRIEVNFFRFGIDASPRAFHLWWESLVVNIMRSDPELRSIGGELCFVEDKVGDLLPTLTAPPASGGLTLELTDDTLVSIGDTLLIIDTSMDDARHFDVVVVTSLVGDGFTINVESIQTTTHNPLSPGLHYDYLAADAEVYRLEAVFQHCLIQTAPELGAAEEGSRAHFRRSIIMSFLTNEDRYGV